MSFRAWLVAGGLTFGAVVAGVMLPHYAGSIAAGWTLMMLTFGSFALMAATRRAVEVEPAGFARALRRERRRRSRPEDLERLERSFGWITYEPREFDNRVRPVLRELIEHRAKDLLGVDIDLEPDRARSLIDPLLIELAGRVRAEDLYDRQLTTDDITTIVARIEELG